MFDFTVRHGGNTVACLDCGDFVYQVRFFCGQYVAMTLDKLTTEQERAILAIMNEKE